MARERFLPWLLCFALGCASTTAQSPARQGKPPRPLDEASIAALIQQVSQIRGLPVRAPIPIYLLGEEQFLLALRQRAERAAQAEADSEAQQAFHLAFDLLPNQATPARISTPQEVLEEQVLGFYDHEAKQIIVRAKPFRTEAEAEKARAILAHEIEHALQDQTFGRPSKAAFDAMGDDAHLAYASLLEGDAMLTMFATIAMERGIPFQRMVRTTADIMQIAPAERFIETDGQAALLHALPIVRERLLFRYHAGTAMVAELYRAGGLDLVNHLFQNPPKSTEQIIHPEKYLLDENPRPLASPNPPPGFAVLGSGSLGELETRIVLERCLPKPLAQSVAAGWGGDRFTLAKNQNSEIALVWSIAWDTVDDAIELERALAQSPQCLRALSLGSAKIQGTIVVERKESQTVLVRGIPEAIAREQAKAILEIPLPSAPSPSPLPYRLVPRFPLPERTPGYFYGQSYYSPFLGLRAEIPLGSNAVVGGNGTELRISQPNALANGTLFVSDLIATPPFQAKIFSEIENGLLDSSEGKSIENEGSYKTPTPLGMAIERRWSLESTPVQFRALIIPICRGTGSLVFLHAYDTPSSFASLDAWTQSFQWMNNQKPPVCQRLDPD